MRGGERFGKYLRKNLEKECDSEVKEIFWVKKVEKNFKYFRICEQILRVLKS